MRPKLEPDLPLIVAIISDADCKTVIEAIIADRSHRTSYLTFPNWDCYIVSLDEAMKPTDEREPQKIIEKYWGRGSECTQLPYVWGKKEH